MVKKIFYQSSLPRAGSTLFQNLMGQNPDFYVTPTSGLIEFVISCRNIYSDSEEFRAQNSELMKKAFIGFCREGMQGYFNSITNKKYILDKSRGWGIHYNLLNMIQPNPKIICVVRDLRDVFTSMEKKYRSKPERFFPALAEQGTTLTKRLDFWSRTHPVGVTVDRLQDIFKMGLDKHIFFIKYEELCKSPQEVMAKVYDYLNLPYFDHDFDNIEQTTEEINDEKVFGVFGDHKIRKKLELTTSTYKEVLGEDSEYIYNRYKWFFDTFNYKKL